MSDNPPWPRQKVSYSQTIIIEIASSCDFERMETYEDNIAYYQSNDYSYIPMPADGKYFDADNNSLKEIHDEQWVILENPAIPEITKFEDNDFLLTYDHEKWFKVSESGIKAIDPFEVDLPNESIYTNPQKLLKEWPEYSGELYDILDDIGGIYIVTPADLNDRRLRSVLYRLISSIEVVLSHAIESAYPDGEELIRHMNEPSIGRWKKAEYEAGQLHPSEYMQFGELKHIASQSPDIIDRLGYDSKKDFNHKLGGAKDLRNRVMHPTKNLIGNKEDIIELNRTLAKLEEFIERSGGDVDKKR